MTRGVHGEKISSALESTKIPKADFEKLKEALSRYDEWVYKLNSIKAASVDSLIDTFVNLLNEYKFFLEVDLIFDSKDDFLYRQKGQLKLDNTVIEEFLPILVTRCIDIKFGRNDVVIGSQSPIFSSIYFASSIALREVGGGLKIKTKNHDFSMSRTIYLKSSYVPSFETNETIEIETNIGYIMAEIKTNLDKTMFQEAAATAHDVKQAVVGAKYYLLCDFLDMQPISTKTTDIDEVIILRKAKRIDSGKRKYYGSYTGRMAHREEYVNFLLDNPYSSDMFRRFIENIFSQMNGDNLSEERVLESGFF